MLEIRTVNVTRYISAFREGGSLPALAEADDDFKYVVKFRGAGHGVKALISELIGGMTAKVLGFHVPELVLIHLDEGFGRSEPDAEIQDLLRASRGLNIALHFLTGALVYDPASIPVDGKLASQVVWLDAFLTNVDRTAKNTNMMVKYRELWLIDHGSSLYFHHTWTNWEQQALNPFPMIKDHVLLPFADQLQDVDKEFRAVLNENIFKEMVGLIPDDWLQWGENQSPEELRDIYKKFLVTRLNHSEIFVKEAQNARETLI